MTAETLATLILLFFCLIFFTVVVMFLRTVLREVRKFRQQLLSPRLTVPAVVDARDEWRQRITFRAESGDLFTLSTAGTTETLPAPGESGLLTFRKKRFIRFVR